MTTHTIQSLDLACKEGSKDAVYHLQLAEVKDGETSLGFVVNYQNGRRGGTLASGTKTKAPVSLEAAQKIFDKVAKEKLTASPPYRPMNDRPTDGAPIRGAAQMAPSASAVLRNAVGSIVEAHAERQTGLAPQLLNDVMPDQLEAVLRDPEFVAQQKFDGERRLVRITENEIIGSNRRGLATPLPEPIFNALAHMRDWACTHLVIDAEIIAEKLYCFDLLEAWGEDFRIKPYAHRKEALDTLIKRIAYTDGPTLAIESAYDARTEADKRQLLAETREQGQEGVVFKHLRAPYQAGRPASGGTQLRHKHWNSATVEVIQANADRRSVQIAARDASGQRIDVGNVTVPANVDIPSNGALIEVRYLYAHQGGSLFQPVLLKAREDKTEADCIESLRLKADHISIGQVDAGEQEAAPIFAAER